MDALFGRRFESAHLHMKPFRIFMVALLLTSCAKSTIWAPRIITIFNDKEEITAKYLFTYDERGCLFTLTEERPDPVSQAWYKSYRISYIYHTNRHPVQALKETFNRADKKWTPVSRILYQYDNESDLPETEIRQLYMEASDSWHNVAKDHFIRNNKDQLLFIVREQWVDNQWENHKKHIYAYNTKGQLTGEKSDRWSRDEKDWLPYTKQTYAYGKQKYRTKRIESWDVKENHWERTGNLVYTLNKYGNVVTINYIPAQQSASELVPLVFFYNRMQYSEGRIPDGLYSFFGSKGTAEYFRKKG